MSGKTGGTALRLCLGLAACCTACRGDVDAFAPGEPIFERVGRLTRNPGDDRSPAWSASGEEILYHTAGLAGVDSAPGVLLRLSLTEGVSRAVLMEIQSPEVPDKKWLLAPAPKRQDDGLAFVEVIGVWRPHACDLNLTILVCTPARSEEEARRPPLMQIAIRTRESDTAGPLDAGPSLVLEVAGVEPISGPPALSLVTVYPFQQLFAREGAVTFRPSWAPDGERLVFGDGLRLLVWSPATDQVTPIPNTEDGAWPAWSPDGELIAFTRLERADSIAVTCLYLGGFGDALCVQERMEYVIGRHVLSIIRPDGGGLRELAEGSEPAWAPDARAIFFRGEGGIVRLSLVDSTVEPVRGAENGREPAVAPDGHSLAFAKLTAGNAAVGLPSNYDIYVVPLVADPAADRSRGFDLEAER